LETTNTATTNIGTINTETTNIGTINTETTNIGTINIETTNTETNLRTTNSTSFPLKKLPKDILIFIFWLLGVKNIIELGRVSFEFLELGRVSRYFREIVNADSIWDSFLQRDYSNVSQLPPDLKPENSGRVKYYKYVNVRYPFLVSESWREKLKQIGVPDSALRYSNSWESQRVVNLFFESQKVECYLIRPSHSVASHLVLVNRKFRNSTAINTLVCISLDINSRILIRECPEQREHEFNEHHFHSKTKWCSSLDQFLGQMGLKAVPACSPYVRNTVDWH